MHTHQPTSQPVTGAVRPVAPGPHETPQNPAEPPRPGSHPEVLRILRGFCVDPRRPPIPAQNRGSAGFAGFAGFAGSRATANDPPVRRPPGHTRRLLPPFADHHAGRTRP